MLKNKWWDYAHDLVFYSAIASIGYALVRIYYDRAQAPAGVCPVSSYQWIINIGIGLAVVYFVMSIIDWVMKKTIDSNNTSKRS